MKPLVVEPEIVGFESPRGQLRRVLGRIALSVIVAALGLGFCLAGALLTITVIGAVIGIPLFLAGLGAILISILLLLGRGEIRAASLRFPRTLGEQPPRPEGL